MKEEETLIFPYQHSTLLIPLDPSFPISFGESKEETVKRRNFTHHRLIKLVKSRCKVTKELSRIAKQVEATRLFLKN